MRPSTKWNTSPTPTMMHDAYGRSQPGLRTTWRTVVVSALVERLLVERLAAVEQRFVHGDADVALLPAVGVDQRQVAGVVLGLLRAGVAVELELAQDEAEGL